MQVKRYRNKKIKKSTLFVVGVGSYPSFPSANTVTAFTSLFSLLVILIAGHRHRGRCISIPAFSNSVRYRSIPVPDWDSLFRYWAGSGIDIFFHPGTEMIRCRTFRRSGMKKTVWKRKKRNTLHVYIAGDVEANTQQIHTAGIYRKWDPCCLTCFMMLINAGIQECQIKVIPASAFLPAVNFVSPASVFRH